MKLSLILLVLSINVAFASHSYAQQVTLSLDIENKKVADVLDEIEKQSEFRFYYNNKLVDVDRVVSVKAERKAVFSILDELFSGHNVEYKVIDKDVILTEKNNPDTDTNIQSAVQQQIKITGVIKDSSGETMPGVSVALKGTTTGTITNHDGQYSINIPDGNAVLVFSMIGFIKQEEHVGTRRTIDITLQEEIREMDEVVVIGYGTVKRVNLGGAVGTADSKVFQSRPVNNAANALQGEIPGLTVIRTSGAPGSSPTVRIRDVSSKNGGSPLIIIDGAEGDLNAINPADIENVSVLKDGSAAIYGSRASDGVILITTKGGKRNQKMKISLDASYSIKTPSIIKKTTNLYQHAVMGLEIKDGSFQPEYSENELALILAGSDEVVLGSTWGIWNGFPKFYKNQDWNDIMIGNGAIQNYAVSLTGGGEKYSYMISLGHQKEDGILKFGTDNNKRYFVRAKSNIELMKNLDLDINLSYEASSRNYSSVIGDGMNIWELIYKNYSWAPMLNPAGEYYSFQGYGNPAQFLEEGGKSNMTTGNFTINNQLRWQVIDGLNILGRAVIRKADNDKNIVNKSIYARNWENVNHQTHVVPNSAERNYSKTLYKNFTLYAEYKKTFGLHDLGLMAGGANESSDYDHMKARRINFDQQENMSLQLGSSKDQEAWSDGNAWTLNSFFSRVNYGFAGKYFVEGTLRADGSSRFHPDHRWGWFPGVNLTWRLGEEKFMKSLIIFDDLKFRASYGEMGNQSGIGLYDYIKTISISGSYYPFVEGQKGQMADVKKLTSLLRTWETIYSKNLGVDFSVLNNRLHGSFDYFWKENKNMLVPVTYPTVLGTSAPATNDGHLKVHGWELQIGWRDQIGNFSYSVRANISDAQNKIARRIGDEVIGLGRNNHPAGYPMSSYFGYVFDGIIQNKQELADYKALFSNGGLPGELAVGDAKYKDLDGDGKLSVLGDGKEGSGDVVYLGNTNPRYSFGLNINMEYKGFDFGAFMQGVGKRTIFLEGEASIPFYYSWFQSPEYWYGKTWTPERIDAKYPAITLKGKRTYNYQVSTNTKHSAAYARLKNIQVGYTLPKNIVSKVNLEKVRFYFSGEDVFEIMNLPDGWDPEDGGSYNGYPFTRNFSFGVNIVF
ncbi:TonB-dependent receptor [Prevotella sp. 10(H)]|uniref:SusC/RagA family TonB-linked outer membrane protein n=1 Tax=Prevotella sp. 10(H) TaxID=1158294 RepID=UPI0004A72429|nr:TonB-dependent receptor [Prevotella sp. 10(H)]